MRDTQATIIMSVSIRNQVRDNANESVSFDLSSLADLETAVMARTDWNNFARAGRGVEIAMPVGTLAFDSDAARSIGDIATGVNIASTVVEVSPNALTSAQQSVITNGGMVFRITVTADNQYVTEFEGNLSITVPFEGTPPVGAWRLANDGTLEQLPSTFDAANGTVTFVTNRLSMFKIGYDPAATAAVAVVADTVAVAEVSAAVLPAVVPSALMRFAIGVAHGDATPFIDTVANRTMVPLRAIAEGLGAEVDWDDVTRTVSITREGQTAYVTIDAPLPGGMGTAVMQNDRTFVPVRYVSEVLGAEVRWDDVNRAVYIY